MKIVFLSRLFYPHIGGVEKHVYEISRLLHIKGHEITIITENHGWKHEETIEGLHIYRIDVGKEDRNKKFRIWNELWKLKKAIADADIVHCHDVFFWFLPFRYLYSKKPVYTTFHGYEGNNIPTKKAVFMHILAEKLSYGNICVGTFFSKWYHTKPSYITFGAVDKKILKKWNKLTSPYKDVIFIGRLELETGILEYLKAVQILKTNNIDLSIDIYGGGSLENMAKSFVKNNNIKAKFHGFDRQVVEYLVGYRYIFTSRYLGILEALAVKRPIFSVYNNLIKKDYLQMTPFSSMISISKDYKQIAEALEAAMLKKKDVNIKKGYEWVEKQTWDSLVEVYLSLWKI